MRCGHGVGPRGPCTFTRARERGPGRRRLPPRGDRAARAHPDPGRAGPRPPALRRMAATPEPAAPEAREQLRAAHDGFRRSGAEAFAERARRGLVATGETVRRPASGDPRRADAAGDADRAPRRRRATRTPRSVRGCSSVRAPSSTTCTRSSPSSRSDPASSSARRSPARGS